MNLYKKFGVNPKTSKPGDLMLASKKKSKWTEKSDDAYDRKHGIKEDSKEDKELDAKRGLKHKKICKMCGKSHSAGKHTKKHKGLKLNPSSKGNKPKGAHGRAAVHALGRTKTTGNFKRIEAAKGKGAAINAYQNALRAHEGR